MLSCTVQSCTFYSPHHLLEFDTFAAVSVRSPDHFNGVGSISTENKKTQDNINHITSRRDDVDLKHLRMLAFGYKMYRSLG
jgi:hypothetical protein